MSVVGIVTRLHYYTADLPYMKLDDIYKLIIPYKMQLKHAIIKIDTVFYSKLSKQHYMEIVQLHLVSYNMI